MFFVSVSQTNAMYDIGTTYGPFVHWQAVADWLDNNPTIRDNYKYVIHRGTESVKDSIEENKPYL